MRPSNLRPSRSLTSLLAAMALFGPTALAAEGCSESGDATEASDPCEGALADECGRSCSANEPCGSGLFCGPDGQCTAECTSDGGQCDPGEECAGGRCVTNHGIILDDAGAEASYQGGSVPLDEDSLAKLADAACTGWSAEPEPEPVVLMMVVDVSGSMNVEDPSDRSRTKWEVTAPALVNAIAALPATTAVGLFFYPNMATLAGGERDLDACLNLDALIEPARLDGPGSSQREALETALETTTPNRQAGTPTHDAYVTALEALRDSPAIGRKYMLLITDGQPTFLRYCDGTGMVSDPVDEQPIIEEIAGAHVDGIDTFIIGSPGSEQNESTGDDARPWLSHAAEEGGTARANCTHESPPFCHFDMVEEADFADGLRRALTEIAGQIVSCEYPLPTPPPNQTLDSKAVNVVMTDGAGNRSLLLRDVASECTVGWRYSEDGSQVLLCGESCEDVKADPKASLELLFGCATQEGPIQ